MGLIAASLRAAEGRRSCGYRDEGIVRVGNPSPGAARSTTPSRPP